MRPLIIVLEDDRERMDWLRRTIIGVEILEYWSVNQFVAAINEHKDSGRLKLVIFDHDLGCIPPNAQWDGNYSSTTDPDGLTGTDAVRLVDNLPCAALVWSLNSDGRKRMCHGLVSKCDGQVYNAPFLAQNKAKIAEVILSHAFPK